MLGLGGGLVHFLDAHAEDGRHLVDERPCSSGAVAVHAHVGQGVLVDEDDFGILAPNVDNGLEIIAVVFRVEIQGDDFLDEIEAVAFAYAHAGRTGHFEPAFLAGELFLQFFPEREQGILDVGVVAFVAGKQHFPFFVYGNEFGGRGSYVDSYPVHLLCFGTSMPNGRWRVPLGIPKLFGIVRPGKSTESKLANLDINHDLYLNLHSE